MNPEEKDPSTSYLTNYKTLEEKMYSYLREEFFEHVARKMAKDLVEIVNEHYRHFTHDGD